MGKLEKSVRFQKRHGIEEPTQHSSFGESLKTHLVSFLNAP